MQTQFSAFLQSPVECDNFKLPFISCRDIQMNIVDCRLPEHCTINLFAYTHEEMSVQPPVVLRRHSGVRVMVTPGEQPPPGGLPISRNSAKGIFMCVIYNHVLTFTVSTFSFSSFCS